MEFGATSWSSSGSSRPTCNGFRNRRDILVRPGSPEDDGRLLVGFGTSMGSGCTSGHGLCGLARLSWRSVVATAVFFGVAMVTVFLTGHVF